MISPAAILLTTSGSRAWIAKVSYTTGSTKPMRKRLQYLDSTCRARAFIIRRLLCLSLISSDRFDFHGRVGTVMQAGLGWRFWWTPGGG
jgi:hypothetical protein